MRTYGCAPHGRARNFGRADRLARQVALGEGDAFLLRLRRGFFVALGAGVALAAAGPAVVALPALRFFRCRLLEGDAPGAGDDIAFIAPGGLAGVAVARGPNSENAGFVGLPHGMSLAALLYIYRVSQTTTVSLVTKEDLEDGKAHVLSDKVVPWYVSIVRIHGPFLFGTTEGLVESTADLSKYAPIVVLRLRNMTAIDETGLHALEMLHTRIVRSGRTLLLCGARDQPAGLLQRTKFV